MPELEIAVKQFNELDLQELYTILQFRAEVFVVEQNCVYQDIDGKDQKALHIIGYLNNEIVAYSRCFDKGFYFEEASIGRVMVKMKHRKDGYGHNIMKASVKAIQEKFNTNNIKLSAQQYLIKFYEFHNFSVTGEGYLEDGIPHIAMVKN